MLLADTTERMVPVDAGVRLHVVEAGPVDGPPVILLHGFPEFWYSWRKQIPALAAAGLHVLAPDMRGYNLSDKPAGVRAYRTDVLARDVSRLLDAIGAERASVVGHDWGAAVAWAFAMAYPTRLDRLAILNVPHPRTMLRGFRTLRQLRKSWYIFFFQLPWLPEVLARAGGFAFVRSALRGSFSPSEMGLYVEAIARPGALTAGINYYRALARYRPARLTRIDRPVLVIWGERDAFLGSELAEPPRDLVPDVRVQRFAEASHWVQNDEADAVNRLLVNFLQ
jgi:pimeloyl-ACP methyl ester carboxylesterase